jgi:2-succinyl-6-hydroxy-2,4-cyclohexadiene-1-carboxylate synthase
MPSTERSRLEQDGVIYAVERRGAGPAVLLLHGFTGSARTWDVLAPDLAVDHQIIAVDLLGHGDTTAPPDSARYTLDRAASDLAGLLDQLDVKRAAVVGYSMGGRLALGFAVTHPNRTAALLLESATAGIADATQRALRREADDRLADTIERGGVERFVDGWERLPLWASQSRLPASLRAAMRDDRLGHSATGLANSLRGFGQGAQPPLHGRLDAVACPVLLVTGAEDAKFCAIADDLASLLRNARAVIVPEAGHAVHLEQPDGFAAIVRDFLQSAVRAGEEWR